MDEKLQKLLDRIEGQVRKTVQSEVEPLKASQSEGILKILAGAAQQNRKPDPEAKGMGAARMVRALAMAKGDPDRAIKYAQHLQDKAWRDDLGDRVVKALQAGDLSEAGFLIEPEFAQEIIEFLYNRAVVRGAGPTILPMVNGSLTLPKQTTSATASYVGESQDISTTQPGGGQLNLVAKKLAALVPVSNDLLKFAGSQRADQFIRNDLVRRLAIREDQAFIRGDGTQNTPKGIRNWAAAANVTATNGTTAAQVEQDFRELWNSLESNNLMLDNATWFMAPRSKTFLMTLRDASSGEAIFPEIRSSTPRLWDLPVFTTNNIPTNLGGGGNESEIMLVNMDEVIIADSEDLRIDVSAEGTYHDGATVVSAFERDETLIRAITQHDLALRHEESAAVKTGITYGV